MTNETLIQVLKRTPKGELTKDVRDRVIPLLRERWGDFSGSAETSMEAWKLDRAEEFQWDPPLLSFTMERHGASVLGSTRAELQRWELNLETWTANCLPSGHRQLQPASPKFDIKPIASRVCEVVLQGREANSDLPKGVVVWKGDDEVWIYPRKLIPGEIRQTITNRRRRFQNALTDMLKPYGWKLATVSRAMIFRKGD